MMNEKSKFIVICLLLLAVYFVWNYQYSQKIKAYTIGSVLRKTIGLKSGGGVDYYFTVKGKKYDGSNWLGSYSVPEGGRFITEFSVDSPKKSRILLYYPIPDSLEIFIPEDGWKEIPDELRRYRIKRTELFGFYDKFFGD
jgi:hypothetical protein